VKGHEVTTHDRVVIVGAGIGGLAAAADLALRGCDVVVLEADAALGGKLREQGPARIDAGPTVFTLRRVFDELFRAAGENLNEHLTLEPADILARHWWSDGSRLDLHADVDRSAEAIAAFAGAREAESYRRFTRRAAHVWRVLDRPFVRRQRPDLIGLTLDIGLHRPVDQWVIMPYRSLWDELGGYFRDPRLRQLFARYATYVGASPFRAPATIMLVAHVEQTGVWTVKGGMGRLVEAVADLARRNGAEIRCGARVASIDVQNGRAVGVTLDTGERFAAGAVVVNADPNAVATGRLGTDAVKSVPPTPPDARSLSALTFTFEAETDAELVRHNVFFSDDYSAEFRALRAGRMPERPTVYLCAQDRGGGDGPPARAPERFLTILNAPANGDVNALSPEEIERCRDRTFDWMTGCGVRLRAPPGSPIPTTPADFERRFPATGGALYGRAGHGWDSAFRRPAARTRTPGLYLCGGATHPGAGVPMAALSGRLAAQAWVEDRASTAL
jgi:1-hydroxycarotenoid 3,4-desaturase